MVAVPELPASSVTVTTQSEYVASDKSAPAPSESKVIVLDPELADEVTELIEHPENVIVPASSVVKVISGVGTLVAEVPVLDTCAVIANVGWTLSMSTEEESVGEETVTLLPATSVKPMLNVTVPDASVSATVTVHV
jgi:hypothetical protein